MFYLLIENSGKVQNVYYISKIVIKITHNNYKPIGWLFEEFLKFQCQLRSHKIQRNFITFTWFHISFYVSARNHLRRFFTTNMNIYKTPIYTTQLIFKSQKLQLYYYINFFKKKKSFYAKRLPIFILPINKTENTNF